MIPVITCVNYADYLAVTLPRTLDVFGDAIVLTDMEDNETFTVASGYGVGVICTKAFYKEGSPFNKGAAIDRAITSLAPDDDWVVLLDADIYLPKSPEFGELDKANLYSPHRRMLSNGPIPAESEWASLPNGAEIRNGEYAGYFQMFHRSALKGSPPWYECPLWRTAQGVDTVFWKRWGPRCCRRLPFEVLHLGPTRVNWSGRVSPRWSVA